jgi:hypothetical protein
VKRGSGWWQRHYRLAKASKTPNYKHHSSKEKQGKEEKKMASSPKRKRTQINPQAPTTSNSHP